MDERESNGRRHSVRLRVSDEELAFLKQIAERDDRTVSYVLRRALRELVEREYQKQAA